MKKMILFAVLAALSLALFCQEQELPPIQSQEQPQVQAEEPPPAQAEEAPAQPQGRDLNGVDLPNAFIHAGKEYAAGKYQVLLGEKDGRQVFFVANDRKEPLFEELAIVKAHAAAGGRTRFHVNVAGTQGVEYMRIRVTTQKEWFLAYFLVKK